MNKMLYAVIKEVMIDLIDDVREEFDVYADDMDILILEVCKDNKDLSYDDITIMSISDISNLLKDDELQMYKSLAENGQSAIDTNKRLAKKLKETKEKLDIAIEALEEYANEDKWLDCHNISNDNIQREAMFSNRGFLIAKNALNQIKEI